MPLMFLLQKSLQLLVFVENNNNNDSLSLLLAYNKLEYNYIILVQFKYLIFNDYTYLVKKFVNDQANIVVIFYFRFFVWTKL